MHKRQKPTCYEQQQYKALSAKLNTQVLALKHDLKSRVREYEKEFYKAQGTFPVQANDPEYRSLQIKVDDTKKLCQFWDVCVGI